MTGPSEASRRTALELVERLGSALKARALYPLGHPCVARAGADLAAAVAAAAAVEGKAQVTLLRVEEELLVEGWPVRQPLWHGPAVRRALAALGVERLSLAAELGEEGSARLLEILAGAAPPASEGGLVFGRLLRRDAGPEQAAPALAEPAANGVPSGGEAAAAAAVVELRRAFRELAADPSAALTRLEALLWRHAEALAGARDLVAAAAATRETDAQLFAHSLRVALLVIGQARGLGLRSPILEEFGFGALLHDFGKLSLPAEILAAQGRLSDAEFAAADRHPEIGAGVLAGHEAAAPEVLLTVADHHLRYDGTGGGLDELRHPGLGAQLVAVADTWDRLLGQVSAAVDPDAARLAAAAVLRHRAGSFLNPFLVEDFLARTGVALPAVEKS